MLETALEPNQDKTPSAPNASFAYSAAALSDGDARYQSLLNHVPNLIVEFDDQGTIRYLSPRFELVAGRTRQALLTKSDWLLTQNNTAITSHDLHLAQHESRNGVHWNIVSPDGQIFQVEGVLWQSNTASKAPIYTALLHDNLPGEDTHLQRLEQERLVLDNLATMMSEQFDLNAMAHALSAQLQRLIPFDLLFISQFQDGKMKVIASDASTDEAESIVFGPEGDIEMARTLVAKQESWLCNSYGEADEKENPDADTNSKIVTEVHNNTRTRAFINVPLQIEGQAIGLLHLDSYRPHVFHDEHLRLAESVASHLAGAVRQMQLLEQARASHERLSELIGQIDAVVWEIDPFTHRYTFVSPRIEQWLGYPASEWINQVSVNVERFVHPEDRAHLAQNEPQFIAPGQTMTQEFRLLAADGRQVWVQEKVTVQFRESELLRLHGVMLDITERKRHEEASRLLAQLAHAINAQSDLKSLVHELRKQLQNLMPCDVLFVSQWHNEAATILAIDPPQHPKANQRSWSLQAWEAHGFEFWQALQRGETISDNDWNSYHPAIEYSNDEFGPIHAYINVPLISNGQLMGVLHIDSQRPHVYTDEHVRLAQLIGQEVTIAVNQAILIEQTQRSAEEMRQSNAILMATQEASSDGMCLIDEQGTIVSYNQRFSDLWRISPAQIEKLHGQQQLFAHFLALLLEPNEFLDTINYLFEHPDASTRDEVMLKDGRTLARFSAPAIGSDGCAYGRVWNFSDITERKLAQQRLEHQAFHDPLTSLPNRALFMQNLARALARAQRSLQTVAVLFLDLDRFKVVNDSLGHETGDQLLIEAAERLRDCLRPGDLAARFGGDEFTVLLEGVEQPELATRVAERIAMALSKPFELGGHEVMTTASVGIVMSEKGGDRAEDLLRDADVAMYRAKSKGRARYEIFDAAMSARAFERLKTEVDLRQGIKRDQLCLHFQPIVNLGSGRIIGAEALVRWQHPEKGLIFPDNFIGLAEESDLIFALGSWVLQKACEQTRIWTRDLSPNDTFAISVNLSARQFQQSDMVAQVAKAINFSGIEAHRLNLEITESVMIEGDGTHQKSLQALKDLGVMLAIDDFGTGYSSLSYLLRFPLDTVKIDKSFVQRALENERDSAIVRAVHDLSQAVGMKVVAEGIETASLLQQLRALGCDAGQGYFFSKPLPAEEFFQLLVSNPQW